MSELKSPFAFETESGKLVEKEKVSKILTARQCQPNFEDYLQQYSKPQQAELSVLFETAVSVIQSYLQLPTPLLLVNSNHWLSAKQLFKQVLPEQQYKQYLLNYDQETLFGRLSVDTQGQLIFKEGELNLAKDGLLILNISPLLVNPSLWFMLKSVLQRGFFLANDAVNAEKIKQPLPDLSKRKIHTKLVLVANRLQMEELIQIDPEYAQLSSLFCELPTHIKINQQSSNAVVSYIQNVAQKLKFKPLQDNAISALLTHLSKLAEHQQQLFFSPSKIKQLIEYAQLFNSQNQVDKENLLQCFEQIENAQAQPRQFSEQSILEGQINLQLSGEKVGQINGLSVVELLGYPCQFGEVFRISASDMLGDGEIIDVERKVELAGNIHAKSTLIVQGYLNHFFSHINAFPFSCNLVFEQSYQESDGDSASLAILIAVSSCYAQLAVKQNIFVTGSLDQHGNVLAIGGINHKIKAVTRLFELNLLSESVEIVIPLANQINLNLDSNTLTLIEQAKIKIHGITHCHQAFPILLNVSFEELLSTISQRIDKMHKEEESDSLRSWFTKLFTNSH